MSGPLLMRGATALARNFPLLLGRHRCEPAALLACPCFRAFSWLSTLDSFIHGQFSLCWPAYPLTTYGDVLGSAGGSWTGAGLGSFGGVTGVSSGSSRGLGSGGSGPGSRCIIVGTLSL